MSDFLYRGTVSDDAIRFVHTLTTSLCNRAVLTHDSDPVAAHLLSRALTSGILLSPMLIDDERFTIRWNYDGIVKSIVVDVGAKADIRGMVSPDQLFGVVDDPEQLLGNSGKIAIVKSSAHRTLNSGITDAGLLDVAEDVAYFLALSDQIESALLVMVAFNQDPTNPVRLCQGFLIQALPDCDLERFDIIRNRMQDNEFRTLVGNPPTTDNYFERLLHHLGLSVTSVSECPPPSYQCHCTREKTAMILKTLDNGDVDAIVRDDEPVTIACHFCATRYTFAADEVARICRP